MLRKNEELISESGESNVLAIELRWCFRSKTGYRRYTIFDRLTIGCQAIRKRLKEMVHMLCINIMVNKNDNFDKEKAAGK